MSSAISCMITGIATWILAVFSGYAGEALICLTIGGCSYFIILAIKETKKEGE